MATHDFRSVLQVLKRHEPDDGRPKVGDRGSATTPLVYTTPNKTLVFRAGDLAVRVKRRTWSRLRGSIRGLILAGAGAAGVYVLRHFTGW